MTTTSTFSHPVLNGIICPPNVSQELLDEFPSLPLKKGDLLVSAYPKSGTTWTEEIIWQLYHNGTMDTRPTFMRIPFLEMAPNILGPDLNRLKELISNQTPRIFKSHFSYDLVPKGNGPSDMPKYIHIMRNPKDLAVSLYHFYRGVHHILYEGTWDDFFEMFIRGDVLYGSWFNHVTSWWRHRDNPNILFLKYEDMIKDRKGAIKQIASFIGKEVSPELIQLVHDQTSFHAMKDKQQFSLKGYYKETEKFMRKDKVGDWMNYFSEEQSQRLDAIYEDKIAGTELEFEFTET